MGHGQRSSLTVRDIGDALLLGQFYSSNGPVTDYGVKDGQFMLLVLLHNLSILSHLSGEEGAICC